jgi:hypothetical protein
VGGSFAYGRSRGGILWEKHWQSAIAFFVFVFFSLSSNLVWGMAKRKDIGISLTNAWDMGMMDAERQTYVYYYDCYGEKLQDVIIVQV